MKNFTRFLRNFYQVSRHVHGVLGILLVLLVLCALAVSRVEGIDFGSALYFAFVTAMTVGYGDITPATVMGRVASVMLGLIGLVFFGLIVAIATRALQLTAIQQDQEEGHHRGSSS